MWVHKENRRKLNIAKLDLLPESIASQYEPYVHVEVSIPDVLKEIQDAELELKKELQDMSTRLQNAVDVKIKGKKGPKPKVKENE